MRKNSNTLKSTIALTLGILFAIVVSEILLQLLDFPQHPVSGWLSCKEIHSEECNSMGFRSKEIVYSDDDFIVLLLGDSEAYASASPFEQIPERRLEHFLQKFKENVKVFTLADMGYGQDQQYLALKKYFEKYRADLVLLMFTARNDIENNIFPIAGKNNTIKPTFWLNNGELHGPTEGWLEPVRHRIKLALLWKTYVGETISESRLEMWKKDILQLPYQPLKQYKGEVDYSWQEVWNESPKMAFWGIEYEKGMDAGMKFTPRSEMRTYGITLTRKLFSEIKKLTEANKGHFIIFKEEKPWELQNPNWEKVYFLNGNYYKASMKQYHDNLKDLFRDFEHYRIPLTIDNYTRSKDNSHLNEQAINKLMKELSLRLSKKEYLK